MVSGIGRIRWGSHYPRIHFEGRYNVILHTPTQGVKSSGTLLFTYQVRFRNGTGVLQAVQTPGERSQCHVEEL